MIIKDRPGQHNWIITVAVGTSQPPVERRFEGVEVDAARTKFIQDWQARGSRQACPPNVDNAIGTDMLRRDFVHAT